MGHGFNSYVIKQVDIQLSNFYDIWGAISMADLTMEYPQMAFRKRTSAGFGIWLAETLGFKREDWEFKWFKWCNQHTYFTDRNRSLQSLKIGI